MESLKYSSRPSVNERAERLLLYLIRKSEHLGMRLSFPMDARMPSPNDGSIIIVGFEWGKNTAPLFAFSDSDHKDEVLFLLDILTEERAIRRDRDNSLDGIVVLPAGYAQAERYRSTVQSKQAFVAMWFNPSMENAYVSGIAPAIRENGYQPLRIDEKEHTNKIDDEIVAEIRRSKFIVADFTSEHDKPRGGVYFEAGFAMGLGIPVIWTCRIDLIAQVHFDTRQFNHVAWTDEADLRKRLSNRIAAVITN